MSFDKFMRDKITVRKLNGEVLDDMMASVQSNKIFLNRSDVLIESKDLIERRMTNGGVETFEVIDPGFNESFGTIKAHYQMSVRKLGLPEAKQRVESIVYNITGHNARVNNNSVDSSINTVVLGGDMREYVDALRSAIESHVDDRQKPDALEVVDAVEGHLASAKPSKVVVSALLQALPHVANVATIASAIISAL